MHKFEVRIEYGFRKTVQVEANSAEDAITQARKKIYDENTDAFTIEVVSVRKEGRAW